MDKAEYMFEKIAGYEMTKSAFYAATPFEVTSPDEHQRIPGWFKESLNRVIGGTGGLVTGAAGGAAIGGGLGAVTNKILSAYRKKKKIDVKNPIDWAAAGAIGLGGLGALAGGISGDIRSLHATESMAGVRKSKPGQIAARAIGLPIPFGDYIISRGFQKHPAVLPSNADK